MAEPVEATLPNEILATLPASRKRGKPWTSAEEMILIQEVLAKENVLFGELKGCTNSKSTCRVRAETWADVASKVTALSKECKRDADEVKKKYFNLKQRAKEKIDKHRKLSVQTGGGPPPPPLSVAEDALVGSMEGRPGMTGLASAVDTDAIETANSTDISNPDSISALKKETLMMSGGKVSDADGKDGDIYIEKRSKRRKKTESIQQEETLKNTILDSERLRLENEKLKLEIEKLKSDIASKKKMEEAFDSVKNAADTVNLYYQWKSTFQ